MVLVVLAVIVGNLAPDERPLAAWFLIFVAVALYDGVLTATLGGTLGKLAVGIRVAELDRTGRPRPGAAARRAMASATFAVLPVVGWIGWWITTQASPLRRGVADRAAGTIVVNKHAALPISRELLAGFVDGDKVPRMQPLGRVPSLEVRRRARLRRLADAPLLVGAMILLIGVASLPTSKLAYLVISSIVWVVAFVIDETRRVARTGQTYGHALAGLAIRSTKTGEPPTGGRSFARALVLGLLLYVPLLWPILGISMLVAHFNDTGRLLHDLAGGTIVVADPRLDPEEQRQRALALSFGKTS